MKFLTYYPDRNDLPIIMAHDGKTFIGRVAYGYDTKTHCWRVARANTEGQWIGPVRGDLKGRHAAMRYARAIAESSRVQDHATKLVPGLRGRRDRALHDVQIALNRDLRNRQPGTEAAIRARYAALRLQIEHAALAAARKDA